MRKSILELDDVSLAPGENPLNGAEGVSLDISLVVDPGDAAETGIHVRTGAGEQTTIGYDTDAGKLFIDRTRSGQTSFHPRFSERHDAPLAARNGQISLRILLDACSVEVFADDGALVMTDLIFPSVGSCGLSVYAIGGSAKIVHAGVSEVIRTVQRPSIYRQPC